MTSRGRGAKQKTESAVVKKGNTIMAAFERQAKKKNCPVCNQSIFLTLYRAHLDNCKITRNDSDCEVLEVLTAEESRALRAGSPIVIESDDVSGPTAASSRGTSQNKQEKSSERRRSKRIITRSESVEEIEVIKVEPNTSMATEPENRPPEVKRRSEPDNAMQVTSIKRTKRTIRCTSPLLENRPTHSCDSGEGCVASSSVQKKLVTADEVVQKIESLLNSSILVSPKKLAALQEIDGDVSTVDFKRAPFIGLSKSARELFMRLHLRKAWWLTVDKLRERYAELSSTIDVALKELVDNGFVDSDKYLSSLEEVLKIAPLPVLRVVAKKYQLDVTKGKIELISTLRNFSATQKGLFGQMGTVTVAMVKTVKKELGSCYRINRNVSMAFKALFTLYAPTEMCSSLVIDQPSLNLSQNLLFTLLRMDQGIVQFPAPNPCQNIISIYDGKDDLLAYVEAKELEVELIGHLSSNKFNEAYECAFRAREILSSLSEESRSKAASLPMSLRRFTAFAILIRCVAHGAGVLERQKKYAIAISWQRFLLKTPELKPFCANSRGALWDRLALNLDAHMKEREEALQEIREGMEDEVVADKDKLMLQDRAIRISNRDFLERIVLMEPVKKEIHGTTLSKELGDSRINRFVLKDADGLVVECAVEEVVRKHYLDKEDFNNGVHAEGSIWHTVLGLLFYDIIFDHDVKNANPIDLNSRDLYENRRERFDERFTWLETAADDEIEDVVRSTWSAQNLQETSEINWELFQSVDDFLEFLFCCPRSGLLAVLRRVITDYRNCRSGFPDLTMWNTKTKKVAVVEVKGPGDRLSTKQRLWLDYFMRHEIRAEVCHVVGISLEILVFQPKAACGNQAGNMRDLVANRDGTDCLRPGNHSPSEVESKWIGQILGVESELSPSIIS
ncbi:VRR-NUC domain protein [Ancylostoma caninum]|uniref:Fanconi-associated nuclease n=1 Tax=Ancylostoma caninum TaxID=29170 RepID=A0A368H1Q3_ANCCA|nr:VRR-NUC domain protein [Ancylostoma caninum]